MMNASLRKIQWFAASIALLAVRALLAGATHGANSQEVDVEVKPVRVEKLANAPGKTLTVVTVNYARGGKSGKHQHAGSVFAYVLSGAIRDLGDRTGQSL
jgi:quercetin dioxygenase-like cupin family protein